jgi:site-specific DNA recombinase
MKAGSVKTAAIYARVSSDRQKEEQTIGSQRAALIEYARSEGYTVPEEWIFQDEGYSGASLVRPGLERLRDLAAEGQLEALLIYSPDRLSRKYAYQVLLCEEFARHGVDVVFIKSAKDTTPEGELLLQFQGMIAEYERAQIAERSRRGKRHRAKAGLVNVLSGAPYGYRYHKKTDSSVAYYEIIDKEAEVVRNVYKLYTEDGLSIGAITRLLNAHGILTRTGRSRWERSTVWAMLRNPAYRGTACFGKTERAERQKITRPLRLRGGFSPRMSANRECSREQWIEIPVPSIVSEEAFALAQEQLEQNKRLSPRRTIEPTLLQGMLVCAECGYAFYRCSTRTSRRKIYYYRCLGSDAYRHLNGPLCHNRPIRQDYLDRIVWEQVIQLLENPDLVRAEIQRRIKEIQDSSPTKRRKEALSKELTRLQRSIEKLLDAYQEGLLTLEELRKRLPELRRRQEGLQSELQAIEAASADQEAFLRFADTIETFLERLRATAEALTVTERQRVLRLVVKEILVYPNTIKIKHSIPISKPNTPDQRHLQCQVIFCVHGVITPPCGTPRLPPAFRMSLSSLITLSSPTRPATFLRRMSCRTLSK